MLIERQEQLGIVAGLPPCDLEDLAISHLPLSTALSLPQSTDLILPRMSGPEFLFFRHVVSGLLQNRQDELRVLFWGYGGELSWMTRRYPDQSAWHATVLEHRTSLRHELRGYIGPNVGIPLSFVYRSNGTVDRSELHHYLDWPIRFEQEYGLVVISPHCLAPDKCIDRLPGILQTSGVALSLRMPGWPAGRSLSDREILSWDIPETRWLAYTAGDSELVAGYRYVSPESWPLRQSPEAWLVRPDRVLRVDYGRPGADGSGHYDADYSDDDEE